MIGSQPQPAIRIRPAVSADAARLALLRYRFRASIAAPNEDEGAFVARAAAWFAARLDAGAWRGWVAVDEAGEIVGNVLLQLVEKVPNPVEEAETIAYVTNLFVLPEQRGRGLGARLMRAALDACTPDRVDTAILWPTPRSAALHRRLGFDTPAALLERRMQGEA